MSRQFNNKKINNSAVNSRKPFCKVCADAGKTDTAHFPRKTPDPNSEVVCPTLLALECRYCLKNGHTVKYCTVLKERNARDDEARREHERHQRHLERQMEQERLSRLPPIVEKKATGKFAAFIDEDEEEERKERQEEEMRLKIEEAAAALVAKREAEFPAFGLKAAPKTAPVATNWAAMAQNAAALPLPKPKAKAVVEEKPKSKGKYDGWADDSDEEYEEEMYESVVGDEDPSSPRPFEFPPLTGSTPCYARSSWDDNDW
jgi:hypothetical protein